MLEVVTLFKENASDIVAMLRMSADNIENETENNDMTKGGVFVQLCESNSVIVYGWGKVENKFYTIGVLQAAILELLNA